MIYYKIENGGTVFFKGRVLYTESGTIFNPTHEQMLAEGWLEYQEPEPTAEELLEMAKQDKISAIAEYDESDAVNVFYLSGQPLWLDAPTRQQLRISIDAYQATGAAQVTKWFGGHQYTFPTALWISMLNALEVYAAEALNVTEAHRAAVSAMTTVEEVENFDITAGYPAVLNMNEQWLQSHI